MNIKKNTKINPNKEDLINLQKKLNSKQFEEAEKLAMILKSKFPDSYILLNLLGTIALSKKDLNIAISYFKEAIKNNFNFPHAHYNLGIAFKANGNIEKSIESYKKAIKINPNFFEAYNNMGNSLKANGNFDEAIKSYNKAIQINKYSSESYNNLGNVFKDIGNYTLALENYKYAYNYSPNSGIILNNLGNIYLDLGNRDYAIKNFNKALKINPNSIEAHINLIKAYERLNELDFAAKSLKKAEQIFIKNIDLSIISARILIRLKNFKKANLILKKNEICLDKSNSKQQVEFYFLLGETFDRLRDFNNAYICYSKSNEFQKNSNLSKRFNKNKYLDDIENLIDLFNKEKNEIKMNSKINSKKSNFVFLIGFPRSGTTLLDTILRGHPNIEVIEEKPLVENLIIEFEEIAGKYPLNLNKINEKDIKLLKKSYINQINKIAKKESKIIIDKLPLNIQHVGLINKIFPDAKYIFMVRHPCDSILSCFIQNFQPNNAMVNFYSLKDASVLYNKILSLWKLYESSIPLNVHYVYYENLVDNINKEVKKITSFLNINFLDSIINYQKTAKKRYEQITTPSYSQVTEALYSRSKFRWNNYNKFFKSILPEINYWIKYWNYN